MSYPGEQPPSGGYWETPYSAAGAADWYDMPPETGDATSAYDEQTGGWADVQYGSVPPVEQYEASENSHRAGERRGLRKVAIAAGTFVVVAGVAASAMFLTRGHSSGEQQSPGLATEPAATSTENSTGQNVAPKKPLIRNGVINLANAAGSIVPVPEAVTNDAASIVTVIGHVGVRATGNGAYDEKSEYWGTGYIGPDGNAWSAAHMAVGDGDPANAVEPKYTEIATNVSGKLQRDAISGYQIPAAFQTGNGYGTGADVDAAEFTIDPHNFIDGDNVLNLSTKNSFSTIPTLKIAGMPKLGEIVYLDGMRDPNHDVMLPPHTPVVEEGVVAAFDGNQVVVVALDQTIDFKNYGGDSGAPVMKANGKVWGTMNTGGYMTKYSFDKLGGLEFINGVKINPRAPVSSELVTYWEVSMDNPANLAQVRGNPPVHVRNPAYRPK